MLSLPPPDFGEDAADALAADQAPVADLALEAPAADLATEALAICETPASGGGPDTGEEPNDDSVPAEVGTQDEKKRQGYRAIEIVEQIHQVQEWLTEGKRPNQIRALCAEHWGLKTRASEQRMQDARRQMVIDVNTYDRKEMAAKMIQSLDTVLNQALEMHQGSNAIGAMRLQADLLQLLSRQN